MLPGVVEALNAVPELETVLAGDKEKLKVLLSRYEYDRERLSIIHAPNVLTNHDNPTLAVHGDNGYTLSAAFDYYAADADSDLMFVPGEQGEIREYAAVRERFLCPRS